MAECQKNRIHFVPTQHNLIFSDFSEEFQKDVLSYKGLFSEWRFVDDFGWEGEAFEDYAIHPSLPVIRKYLSKKSIESLGGFMKNEDEKWSLSDPPPIGGGNLRNFF